MLTMLDNELQHGQRWTVAPDRSAPCLSPDFGIIRTENSFHRTDIARLTGRIARVCTLYIVCVCVYVCMYVYTGKMYVICRYDTFYVQIKILVEVNMRSLNQRP